jgi:two-component sensor histidine kinase
MNAPDPLAVPSKRRVLLRDTVLVLALNTVVAAALALIALVLAPQATSPRVGHLLLMHLVFAQAIGLSIFALIEWPRLTLWWQRPPGLLALGGVTVVSIPVGYVLGRGIASALFGMPVLLPLSISPVALLVVFTTVLASLVAVHLITQRDRLEAERLRAENAIVRAASARLQLLQQQIEPHMLFNTLANVHALIDDEPTRAQQLLEALSEMLHASMQTGEQASVTLQQEFNLLEQYLKVMAIRMGARLRYTLVLPPDLATLRLPPLTVQPLVENAVKHGLDAQLKGGSVHVAARREGGRVIVEVIDDGQGLQVDEPFAAGRIGLPNLRKRLGLAFGDTASLALADNPPHGARATLAFPV